MIWRVFFAATLAAFATAANADAIDPCSLLSDVERVELGLSTDSEPSRESQPGGVQACKYQLHAADASSSGVVSIILSQGVPDRVLQLRAMQAAARQTGTPAQQQARGDYFKDDVMCKVLLASRRETSQCIGASGQSVVALAISRPAVDSTVIYPASQLRIIANMVARVASKGN